MQILRDSTLVRVIVLLVVALFAVVCGIHIAGAHHDGHIDGLTLTAVFSLVMSLLFLLNRTAALLPAGRPTLVASGNTCHRPTQADPAPPDSFRGSLLPLRI